MPCSVLPQSTSRWPWHILPKQNQSSSLLFAFLSLSFRGNPTHGQSRQNIVIVQGMKRAGYRPPGSQQVTSVILHFLLAFESSWETPTHEWVGVDNMGGGRYTNFWFIFRFVLGNCVLSLCGGSGSLMEAAMNTGRSCIMFEANRKFSSFFIWIGGMRPRVENKYNLKKSMNQSFSACQKWINLILL